MKICGVTARASCPGLLGSAAVAVALVAWPAPVGAFSWSAPVVRSQGDLFGLACPTDGQCTAVGAGGLEVTFDPTSPTSIRAEVGGYLWSVACPSTSQCTAASVEGDESTFDPLAPGVPTLVTLKQGSGNFSVACVSISQCTTTPGDSQDTFDPARPTDATPTNVEQGAYLPGLACPSANQCTVVDFLGGNEITFNPVTSALETDAPVDRGSSHVGLACPSVSQCTAIEGATPGDPAAPPGGEVTFEPLSPGDPTPIQIDAPGTALSKIACPSIRQCTALDVLGHEITFDPTAPVAFDPAAAPTFIGAANPTALACSSVSLCVATAGGSSFVGRVGTVALDGAPLREHTPPGLTAGALRALLRSTAVPRGSAPRIGALLAHRYVASLTAPSAGRLTVAWYFVPHGAHVARATHAPAPVRVASGRASAAKAGPMKITIALTSAGRRLLHRARRVALTARATFAPAGLAAQTATKTFTVRR
jgi:hypothetical protein